MPFVIDAPPGRTGHIAVFYENYLFVWGGYRENPGVSSNTYFNGDELWIYSCSSEKWYLKRCPSTKNPPGMSGCTAVIIGDNMYLFGGYGYNGQGCTNKLYKLDLMTFTWMQLIPRGLCPFSVDKMVSWAYNGKFYIFGGFGNPNDGSAFDVQFVFYYLLWRGWTNQFFEYDPEKNCWNRPVVKGTLPCARAAHAAAILKDKVYIFGGRHDQFRLNDLHCLEMETMKWSGKIKTKGPAPEGRSWHSLTALSERYLILYGGFSQNNVPLSDCWRFDTQTNTWLLMELSFDKPRLWHCACLNAFNEVLIYGGTISNILDLERIPEQANDIVVIRTTPQSLFRICIDQLIAFKELQPFWFSLPHHLQKTLHLRLGHFLTSNLDGS